MLCLSGSPGCGKTVLCASLVNHLKSEGRVLFFPFSGNDRSRQDQGCLLRSLLWQSIQGSEERGSLKIVHDLILTGSLSNSKMMLAFKNVLALCNTPLFCLIDGVDECRDSIQLFLDSLVDILGSHNQLHVAIFGQPLRLKPFIDFANCNLTIDSTLIQKDIDLYIQARIRGSEILKFSELEEKISQGMQKDYSCVFLVAKLILDDLCKSVTKAEVTKRLDHLPRELEQAYRLTLTRLITRLDAQQILLARSLLGFLVASLGPLSGAELQHAYASEYDHSAPFEHNLLSHPELQILEVLDGLVIITNDRVSLVHLSLLHFLTRPEVEWACRDDQRNLRLRIDLEESHRGFSLVCINYLRSSECGIPTLESESCFDTPLTSGRPLLKYATRHGFEHVYLSSPADPILLNEVYDFVQSKASVSWLENLAILSVKEDAYHLVMDNELQRLVSWLESSGLSTERIMKPFRAHLREELSERRRRLGEEDPRTEQCEVLLELLQPDEFTCNTHDEGTRPSPWMNPFVPSTTLPSILGNFDNIGNSPLLRQLHMLLRLRAYTKHLKALPDALEILFRLILRRASQLPVIILLGIADFYKTVNKLDKALALCELALKKVETKEAPLKYAVLHRIGSIHFQREMYAVALEYFLIVRIGTESLPGYKYTNNLENEQWIAKCYCILDDGQLALQTFQQVLAGYEKLFRHKDIDTLDTKLWVGLCYHRLGNYQLALQTWKQVLADLRMLFSYAHPRKTDIASLIKSCLQIIETATEILEQNDSNFLEDVSNLFGYDTLDSVDGIEWERIDEE